MNSSEMNVFIQLGQAALFNHHPLQPDFILDEKESIYKKSKVLRLPNGVA
jgi:hypothetical protein